MIQYLNTDLDLKSVEDLRPLVRELNAAEMTGFDPQQGGDCGWYASVSMSNAAEPEQNISDMLRVIESLPPETRRIWEECTLREFNIGYDCGAEPWAFNQGLSAAVLTRLAAVGASLRITLYPGRNSSS